MQVIMNKLQEVKNELTNKNLYACNDPCCTQWNDETCHVWNVSFAPRFNFDMTINISSFVQQGIGDLDLVSSHQRCEGMFPAFALSIAAMTCRKIGCSRALSAVGASKSWSTTVSSDGMEKSGFTWLSSFDIAAPSHAPKHNEIDTIDLDKNIIMLVVGAHYRGGNNGLPGRPYQATVGKYYRFFPRISLHHIDKFFLCLC